jgi:hypothetical protein
VKVVGVADSDSYLKWGASVLDEVPADWEKKLVLIQTPVAPSETQSEAALAGTGMRGQSVDTYRLDALVELVAAERPDVMLLALRGPVIRVLVRAILARGGKRPLFVSGMPGISFPATKRALWFRGQIDLMLVHSKHEREAFAELAERLGLEQRFGLATLAFLARDASGVSPTARNIVFATQAKVPRTRKDRLSILEWLRETAERHPHYRIVMKLRAVGGEMQTHAERYPFDEIVADLGDMPDNFVFEGGSMSDQLDAAAALVTVSSTAALESAARGIPTLVLDDFGVSRRLINLVFEGSNLLGSSEDLMAARFSHADPEWLDYNYFHADADNDWLPQIEALVSLQDNGGVPVKPEARQFHGGELRRAWDRKQVFGEYDTSTIGRVAVVIGTPVRATYIGLRRTRRNIRRAFRRVVRRFQPPRPLLDEFGEPVAELENPIELDPQANPRSA